MDKPFGRPRALFLCGAALMLTANPARAAEPAPAPANADADGDGTAIIVTGTRQSARTVTESLAPIDVLSAKDLQTSGKQSVRDLLGTLVPSINVSNSGSGASFAVKTLCCAGWRAIRCSFW
jgi:iron complex outermembrane receptor protein